MRRHSTTAIVIAAFSVVIHPVVQESAAQRNDPIVESETYKVLSEVIPRGNLASSGELLIQRETTIEWMCMGSAAPKDSEWVMALADFRQQNARTRVLLESLLPLDVPHRFIARSEIEADDARLALKYPGQWQRRPESLEFVAVSAVGFNPLKTKAVVYVRTRDYGSVRFLERADGRWVRASIGGCGWGA